MVHRMHLIVDKLCVFFVVIVFEVEQLYKNVKIARIKQKKIKEQYVSAKNSKEN